MKYLISKPIYYSIALLPSLLIAILLHDMAFTKTPHDSLFGFIMACIIKSPNWSPGFATCQLTLNLSLLSLPLFFLLSIIPLAKSFEMQLERKSSPR